MALLLEYRAETSIPVEVDGLVPEAVRDKSLGEIERLPLFYGNRSLPLAEFFDVSGDPSDLRIELEGDLAGVHWIGAKMTCGEIRVAGPVGRHAGSEMRGGEIQVEGDAGDWLGAEMHGGLIRVRGSAGHLAGSAYRGSARGMTKGTIVIGGDAGNEVGHSMRRGLIAVGGSIGDCPGVHMIAGSLFVMGGCGVRPAAGMRRGSLVLLGDRPTLLPTFKLSGHGRPLFLRIYLLHLRRLGLSVSDDVLAADCALYYGDLLTGGRGEVVVSGG
jgi:formylmethanofuran dehydrogenase subunit C